MRYERLRCLSPFVACFFLPCWDKNLTKNHLYRKVIALISQGQIFEEKIDAGISIFPIFTKTSLLFLSRIEVN